MQPQTKDDATTKIKARRIKARRTRGLKPQAEPIPRQKALWGMHPKHGNPSLTSLARSP